MSNKSGSGFTDPEQSAVTELSSPSLTVHERAFPAYICAGSGVLASSPSECLSHVHSDCSQSLNLTYFYYWLPKGQG